MSELDNIRDKIKVQRERVREAEDRDSKFLRQESIFVKKMGKEAFRDIEEKLHLEIFDEERKLRELEEKERNILYQ